MTRYFMHGLLGLALLAAAPRAALAGCGDNPGDDAAVAATRADADQACEDQGLGCSSAPNHGQHVQCIAHQANAAARTGSLPTYCKGAVTECAARSTCGKPGAVTCCISDECEIANDAAECAAQGGSVGSASSCCDACASPSGAFLSGPEPAVF